MPRLYLKSLALNDVKCLTSEPNKNRINDMLHWLINDGQKTLDSYKKNGKRAMKSHLEYLASLPLYVESDNYFFVHAGVNPTRKIEDQTEQDLLWIRHDFLNASDLSIVTNKTIIFGHTPTRGNHRQR